MRCYFAKPNLNVKQPWFPYLQQNINNLSRFAAKHWRGRKGFRKWRYYNPLRFPLQNASNAEPRWFLLWLLSWMSFSTNSHFASDLSAMTLITRHYHLNLRSTHYVRNDLTNQTTSSRHKSMSLGHTPQVKRQVVSFYHKLNDNLRFRAAAERRYNTQIMFQSVINTLDTQDILLYKFIA